MQAIDYDAKAIKVTAIVLVTTSGPVAICLFVSMLQEEINNIFLFRC